MTDEPNCGNCRFWLNAGPDQICRRFPPQTEFLPAAQDMPPRTISYFPGMKAEGWCGEWRKHGEVGTVTLLRPELGDGIK